MSTQAIVRPASTRRRTWVPNQHGAWAMLALPIVVGLVAAVRLGAFAWWSLPLAGAWLIGYFAFFFASLWLKSARRRGGLQVAVYAGVAGILAVPALIAAPSLLWWAPVFAPLVGAGLWLAARRRDRSVASGLVTVLAAALFTLVLADPLRRHDLGWHGWSLAMWQAAYFFGTVLYVKTMIRERGQRQWLLASVGYHLGCLALAVLFGGAGLMVFFALGLARAAVVPSVWPMRGRSLRPALVGVGELGFSVALLALLAG